MAIVESPECQCDTLSVEASETWIKRPRLGQEKVGGTGGHIHLFPAEEVVDFRQLHSDVCAQLLSLSEEWEEKEKILEHTSEDIPNREEGEGE